MTPTMEKFATLNKEDMYRLLTILGQNRITPNYNYDKGYIILNYKEE